MKRIMAFLFFMLFLAGMALVKLKGMHTIEQQQRVEVSLVGVDWWAETGSEASAISQQLRFEADGSLSGSGGCNRITGRFVATDETIQIDSLGLTRRSCDARVMTLESTFVQGLQTVTRYRIDANRLTLAGDDSPTLLLIAATESDSEQDQE